MNLHCRWLIWVNEPPEHEKSPKWKSLNQPFWRYQLACIAYSALFCQRFSFRWICILLKSTIDISGSLYLLRSSLQWGVLCCRHFGKATVPNSSCRHYYILLKVDNRIQKASKSTMTVVVCRSRCFEKNPWSRISSNSSSRLLFVSHSTYIRLLLKFHLLGD